MSPTPTPASVAARPLLDTRYKVETPEGIDLILRPAGVVPRALAFSIDLLIRGALLGALFLALTTPVSAHLLARAALQAGHQPQIGRNSTQVDK